MLGAQTIQAKQKNKEKKKKSFGSELQCERIQKTAREDDTKFLEKFAHLHLEDARAVSEVAEKTKCIKKTRHYSVQEPCPIYLPFTDDSDDSHLVSKNPSTSFKKMMKTERDILDSANTKGVEERRLSKLGGLFPTSSSTGNSRQTSKKPEKRRMSTFI